MGQKTFRVAINNIEGSNATANYIEIPSLTLSEITILSGMAVGAIAYCDILGVVCWNGFYWRVLEATQENFMTGSTGFSATPFGGGTTATEIPEQQPFWNNTTLIARLGQFSGRINTNAGARLGYSVASLNYRLFTGVKIYRGMILAFVGGQVDFTNDPVLQCWGYLDSFATATPLSGIYFRPPRLGETAFLKCVVRVAGAEAISDTTIPYDSTSRRYIKGDIIWDGINVHFWATDTLNKSLTTIPNFLTAYPSFASQNLSFGTLLARNGTATVPVAQTINIDIAFERISS